MKRFTETNKWDDPWFRALSAPYKLIFSYVTDRCNNAGFWEIDADAMAFHTKLDPKHFEGAWKGLQRGIKGAGGWVWVRRFLRHQKNEDLNVLNPAHKQIISLIREQKERFREVPEFLEFIAPWKGHPVGLLSPIGTGTGKVQVQEEGMQGEKELPSLEACLSQIAASGINPEFARFVYADWSSRGGKDAAGTDARWARYITKRWAREKDKWDHGMHNGQRDAGESRPVIPAGKARCYDAPRTI